MSRWRYLWLGVPGLALVELTLHVWFSQRAPRVEEWRELSAPVRRLKSAGTLLVVAPEWAEPIARHALGDGPFPLEELGRADASSFRHALEVSALGARAEETRSWRVVSEETSGRFVLRMLANPRPVTPRYRFIDHVRPGELLVSLVTSEGETPCPFDDHARASAGGLHGHVAFPRERFVCSGGESSFVGITIIDDQRYLPRRCIWAHPPPSGSLRLRFDRVPLGTTLRGWAGLSYFQFRDGVGSPVALSFSVGGRLLGRHEHHDEWGFRAFSLATPGLAEHTSDVEVDVRADPSPDRDFCFVSETL